MIFVKSARLGDNVTLHCEAEGGQDYLYWYKQSPGYFPEMVASKMFGPITMKPNFDIRFTVEEGATVFNLIIQNITKGDEGNYFCQQYSRDKWNNFTFLSVNGRLNNCQCLYSIS